MPSRIGRTISSRKILLGDERCIEGCVRVPAGEEEQEIAVDGAAEGLAEAGAAPHGGTGRCPPSRRRVSVLVLAGGELGEVDAPPEERVVQRRPPP
jgi:hypothetical protein